MSSVDNKANGGHGLQVAAKLLPFLSAIHSLALLGRDSGFINGVRVPQQVASTNELLAAITSETPENPTIILSAIGLILYLIQQFRKK